MRKIDIENFQRATRDTPREVNRRIVLNLIREHGPVSRADLARMMGIARGMITPLVNELLEEDLIYEGRTARTARGRRPTLLHLRSFDRFAVGINVGTSHTVVELSDFAGRRVGVDDLATPDDPGDLVTSVATIIEGLLETHGASGTVEGVGIVVPGMVDARTRRVLRVPTLGWRDVDVHSALEERFGLPVRVERDAVACAMARMWLAAGAGAQPEVRDFVYVVVAEGVGAGLVVNGAPVRGRHFTAGEFGHVPLDPDGPVCDCGSRGCLEAFASDVATRARFLGLPFDGRTTRAEVEARGVTMCDVIAKADDGDGVALAALRETGRFLGLGLAGIVNALDPSLLVVGGDIARAWSFVADDVVATIRERALTPGAAAIAIELDDDHLRTRLKGAAALVVAPSFAAPSIA